MLERLIKLIDEGDPEVILAEDALVSKFNELLKHDLVVIKDDRVFLTEKGQTAKIHGFDFVIEQEKKFKKSTKKAPGVRVGGKMYTTANLGIKLRSIHLFALILLLTMALLYFYLPVTGS